MKKIVEDTILAYIETHLDMEYGQDDIAEAFGYSTDHFRHLFRMYYDMPLGEYIRRRRLLKAAERIGNGELIGNAASLYGFETAAGFAKAFRKEFGFPAGELKRQDDIRLDVLPEPEYDRNQIRISFLETQELKMAGRSVIPEEGADIDLLEEVAYWLDHEFPEIDNSEFSGMQCFKDDHIAMWYHPLDSQEITYLMGPVVKKFSCVPEGLITVTIPGRRYAVFETKQDSDKKELAETVRYLCKYIFREWVPANDVIADRMGFTFERYYGNKVTVYLPLI